MGAGLSARTRSAEIMADAAHAILDKPARNCTGNFFIDELLLRAQGIVDFDVYASDPRREPAGPLALDFFVPTSVMDEVPDGSRRFVAR